MSLGSKRITIRVGDEICDDIRRAVELRNDPKTQTKHWTMTEYVIQAIVDKLNHDLRGRRRDERKRQAKIDDNQPREYWEE